MPDIEKRLEAFVRISHGIIIFPGGAGTAEELLYILGILLNPKNQAQKLPIILTGPASSEEYFKQIDSFIGATLGKKAQQLYPSKEREKKKIKGQLLKPSKTEAV